jgi:hypothetical protein
MQFHTVDYSNDCCAICREELNNVEDVKDKGGIVAHGVQNFDRMHRNCLISALKVNRVCPCCRAPVDVNSVFTWKDRVVTGLNSSGPLVAGVVGGTIGGVITGVAEVNVVVGAGIGGAILGAPLGDVILGGATGAFIGLGLQNAFEGNMGVMVVQVVSALALLAIKRQVFISLLNRSRDF